MALLEMSSDVPFVERTADDNNAMEINREGMAETEAEAEAAAVAEEEEYRLRALEFLYLHRA